MTLNINTRFNRDLVQDFMDMHGHTRTSFARVVGVQTKTIDRFFEEDKTRPKTLRKIAFAINKRPEDLRLPIVKQEKPKQSGITRQCLGSISLDELAPKKPANDYINAYLEGFADGMKKAAELIGAKRSELGAI